ncbi:MAG: rhodanese-like domain-containing protein [Pyrinomonadaceae bacterium]
MSLKKNWRVWASTSLLILLTPAGALAVGVPIHSQARVNQPASPAVEFITVEELKAKLAGNERVTIVDVRSTGSYTGSDDTIRGAIHVKLRRLKSRLAYPPLKNASRDVELITYCACPSDDSSVYAAHVFLAAGFKRVRVLKGGWQEWLKAGGQVEPRPKPS